jgi:hypothetical protein
MIRHFDVWPETIDKNNLFEEQKIFLIYLIGFIPSLEDWSFQSNYKTKLYEIENIKHVEITDTEIDIAKLQDKSIDELKKEKLKLEKEKRIRELKKSFGVEIEEEKKYIEENPKEQKKQDMWELLNRKNNGLQT